jgi:hypothetical protein
MSVRSGADAGKANLPGVLTPDQVRWAKTTAKTWWRNTHKKAPTPLAFSNAPGRFSDPKLPFKTLYLGTDAITCFWESGLGQNLALRFPSDRTITEDDLKARVEYRLSLESASLLIFDAEDSAARRSVGAHSLACFLGDHFTSRQWAQALNNAGAHGILYPSARGNGTCLALFESAAASSAVSSPKKVASSYDDAPLLASLFREGVRLLSSARRRSL